MKRKTVLLLLAALAVAAVAAGGALSATTSVTIATPKTNQKVSLKQSPYLAVAGAAKFAATTAGTSRFFLRRDGCGTSNDNPHLSVASGTDAGDGCGLIINQVGLVGNVDQSAFIDFPASNGMPLAYDGTQPVDGQISLTGAQVGEAQVQVSLEALVGGNAVDLGSTTSTALLDPTGASTPVPFTIQPNTSLDGSDVQALDLRVQIEGAERLQRLRRAQRRVVCRPPELRDEREQVRRDLGGRPDVLEPGPGAPERHELERGGADAERRQAHDLRRVDAGVHHLVADERDHQRDAVRGRQT